MNRTALPLPEPGPFWQRHFYALGLGALLVLATAMLFPISSLVTPAAIPKVGDLAVEDVVAPSTLPLRRTRAELEVLRDSALRSVPLVFRYEEPKVDSVRQERRAFFVALDMVGSRQRTWDDLLLSFPHLTVPSRLQDARPELRNKAALAIDSALTLCYRFGLLRNELELPLSESRTAAIRSEERRVGKECRL